MNDLLKALATKVGLSLTPNTNPVSWFGLVRDLERFAELVRADEREANAKLCEKLGNNSSYPYALRYAAESIRARGNRTKTSKDICDND
jgi:hypothetical protein